MEVEPIPQGYGKLLALGWRHYSTEMARWRAAQVLNAASSRNQRKRFRKIVRKAEMAVDALLKESHHCSGDAFNWVTLHVQSRTSF